MAKKVIYMLDRFNDRLIWAVKWLDRILRNENVFFQHYSEPGQFRHADSDAVCLVDPAGDNVAAAFFGSAGISAYIYSQK